ncbi:FG-GAP-like repeat-containing protein [Kitasatospora sp. NPDC092948]|uniref:FG-GAP-like repeat-containing protein n=1 Tax=Kitasatospora sp. NPDC092948 TaxID=3364088 RepID=UPI003812D178
MPVPTEELKLEIVNAATGKTLGPKAAANTDGPLVVRDVPEDGPDPAQWQLAPITIVKGGFEPDDQAYVIRGAAGGKVFDDPAGKDRALRQAAAAAGRKGQQWHVVPIEGEVGLYFIECATDGAVLDLGEPAEDGTPVVLREYDDSSKSQRWRFVTAEPERTGDPVLRFAHRDHWNGRRSWPLVRSTALRPAPGAAPSFSDMLLVLERFGTDKAAGEWEPKGVNRVAGQPGWWAGVGARFLADTTGKGRHDLVGLRPVKGAVTSAGRGDGTFEEDEQVLHKPASTLVAEDLWTLADVTGDGTPEVVVLAGDGVRVAARGKDGAFPAGELVVRAFGHHKTAGGWLVDRHPRFLADTTGDGRLDVVGCHDDGVWVSRQAEDGTFAELGEEPALRAFGQGEEAGGWLLDRHPRFLADTTGDGRLDVVGCHDDGVWVSLQAEDGTFGEPALVLGEFGTAQGWDSAAEHPRFLIRTAPDGPVDVVGFGPQGVAVSRGRGDGTFAPAQLVLNDYGTAQGWTPKKHLRFLADVTGDGAPDIVAFGDEGVWVSHGLGQGRFEQAQLVCRGFGHNNDAGAWRVDRHPRFVADITGDGRVDLVGFGGPGVYVARNLFRRFRTR